jgi:general secretion pathway protein L
MADTLIVRLPSEADAALQWIGVDRRGQLTTQPGAGAPSALAAAATGQRVVLLVPGQDVSHLVATVPAVGEARLAQLLPFALEVQVAEDIDSLLFAAGPRLPDGTTAADVVSRSRVQEWLALQSEWGITFDAIHSESELVPELAGHVTLLIEKDVVTLRMPGKRPALLPVEDLWLSLELGLGADADLSQQHVLVYATAVDWQRRSAEVEALRPRFASLKVQLLSAGVLPLLAQHLHDSQAINLRQGAYAAPRPMSGTWRAWRLAAVLAGALFALHLLSQGLELRRLHAQERALDTSLAQTLQGIAPGERYGTDLRRRMEKRLATAGSAGSERGSLLGLLAAVAQARQTVPSTRVEALSFRQGALELRVQGPDAGALERINQALRTSGLKSDLTSGGPRKDSYEGRMQVNAGT